MYQTDRRIRQRDRQTYQTDRQTDRRIRQTDGQTGAREGVSPSVHLEALQLIPLLGQGGVQVQVAPVVGQLQGAVIQLGTEREDVLITGQSLSDLLQQGPPLGPGANAHG